MSGHAGFQSIGGNMPSVNLPPQIGGAEGPGLKQGQSPSISGGDDASLAPEAQPTKASSLTQKLDAMLLQAAKMSTNVASAKSVNDAATAAGLGKSERSALAAAARKAQMAMKAIEDFTGREIGSAFITGESGAFDWEGGSAFRDYLLPEAAIKFRQGFGRLVRSKRDRGVVIVTDPRIVTKNYGAVFRRSIPASVHTVADMPSILGRMADFALGAWE